LDDQLPARIQQLQEKGIELKVETNLDKSEFITDPNPYTEVVQSSSSTGPRSPRYTSGMRHTRVVSGGMGTGWGIEQGDTSIYFNVQALLALLEL
jgi:hypothetical protein